MIESEKFKELAESWKAATDQVLNCQEINRKDLSDLFRDTYVLIKTYSTETMIPRALYQVLWEMNDFHQWVIHSEKTPIFFLRQEIISLVIDLNYFVVRGWANELDIQYQILKIEGAI